MENADPAHHRTGWVLEEDKTSLMLKHVTECKLVIHRDRAIKKEPLTHKEILDCIDILRGVVQISYPAYHGLGDWEPARGMLELPDLQAFYNPEQLDVIYIYIYIVYFIGDRSALVGWKGVDDREATQGIYREQREDQNYGKDIEEKCGAAGERAADR